MRKANPDDRLAHINKQWGVQTGATMPETDLIIMRFRQILVWLGPGLVAILLILLALSVADRYRRNKPPRNHK